MSKRTITQADLPLRYEYDNHGNGGFAEWWDIKLADGYTIGQMYSLQSAELVVKAIHSLMSIMDFIDVQP